MKTTEKNYKNILKIGILTFIATVIITIFYAIKRLDTTDENVNRVEYKVDSRYTSYDNLFFYDKVVVIDEEGKIIGNLIFKTNEEEIKEFYKDATRRKTRQYYQLIEGEIKYKEK